ncbi:D-glycero-D-manno-heptose 1,7-bisphosphate phosphatase [Geminocystis sp. NIES-3708]|uniref:D-glycero-alpha-D-manno-heptose-1,7-bisphosphate 7-phosphatase n=1 Tax=Geminocystis sp. NIES-3708 TaxID=1615909 RepID=UPI0005FC61BC|nr:HAD family hydrolase [Geminocystis sp. NIES-3708]BAQ63070.1 D-glycero-D-manno-heptose 1,7-bisphosphate phosphatase [Geminocystis sp. NIES-3708]
MKTLFLDRDGVVIDYIPYLSHPEQVSLPQGAAEALKIWQNSGYKLVIVTNQSGISRGYFSLEEVKAIHKRIIEKYRYFGVEFADILMCPHQPSDNCNCRKPLPSLILNYSQKYNINLSQSFFIGDAPSDIECAFNAGCQPVLLLTGRGKETQEKISKDKISIPIFENLSDTLQLINH